MRDPQGRSELEKRGKMVYWVELEGAMLLRGAVASREVLRFHRRLPSIIAWIFSFTEHPEKLAKLRTSLLMVAPL